MASDRPEYKRLGWGGVNLTNQKYTPTDGAIVQGQNAELVQDKTKGGRTSLRKRGGLPETGAAFSSGVYEMYEVKFVNGSDLTPDVEPGDGFFRPISDLLNVGDDLWLPEPIFSRLDEVVADDSDYVSTFATNSLILNNNQFIVGLTPETFTGIATGGTLRIRARYTENGNGGNAKIQMFFSGTLGAVFVSQIILRTSAPLGSNEGQLTTSFQTFEFDLADCGYTSGSFDWSDMQLQFQAAPDTNPGIVATDTVEISWVEFELTHA